MTGKIKLSDLEVIAYIVDNEYRVMELVAEYGLKCVIEHIRRLKLNELYRYQRIRIAYQWQMQGTTGFAWHCRSSITWYRTHKSDKLVERG